MTVAGGAFHALARTASNYSFFSTGNNSLGQLGDGSTTHSLVYTRAGNASGQPLPVQLTQFTAWRADPATVRLSWTTASEVQNAGFGVESSPDGHTWTRRARVPGAGRSTSPCTYAAPVAEAAAAYYRLAQTDFDGTAQYEPVQFVGGGPAPLHLYPNPTHDAATLSGAAPAQSVRVLDALGRVAATATTDASATARLVGLPPGLYLVRCGKTTARLAVE